MQNKTINIIGAGLAGSECALFLADNGIKVNLYDIKGESKTPAHHLNDYAELVCSNSLKSDIPYTASGILKQEMLALGSNLLKIAYTCNVGAGGALAVDRELFAKKVTEKIKSNKNITTFVENVADVDSNAITVIASGPLSTENICKKLSNILGKDFLYFFDAASPIISADSIDKNIVFEQNRYQKGEPDYINCPFDKEEYLNFYNELVNAKTAVLKDFENKKIFEGCMPIEVLAKRGLDSIRFGAMKPVGLINPNDNKRPYAAVQLRKENNNANLYNIVGFQTNLTFSEQKRVFSMIPGLKNAEFFRYGVMHKNIFTNFPVCLDVYSRVKSDNNIFIAGQLSGVEGYVESMASGLYCGINILQQLKNEPLIKFTSDTVIGGLYNYLINADINNPQPINANLGIINTVSIRDKIEKGNFYNQRSKTEIDRIKILLKGDN